MSSSFQQKIQQNLFVVLILFQQMNRSNDMNHIYDVAFCCGFRCFIFVVLWVTWKHCTLSHQGVSCFHQSYGLLASQPRRSCAVWRENESTLFSPFILELSVFIPWPSDILVLFCLKLCWISPCDYFSLFSVFICLRQAADTESGWMLLPQQSLEVAALSNSHFGWFYLCSRQGNTGAAQHHLLAWNLCVDLVWNLNRTLNCHWHKLHCLVMFHSHEN